MEPQQPQQSNISPMYSQQPPQHPHHPHPQSHPQPHWVHAPPPPQQGPPPPHPQQHMSHPMAPNPYMQYPPQAHPHYYPHHPQQMQPPPHQSPYAVAQPHPNAPPQAPPPQMGAHPQQSSIPPMYSQHPHHPHPQSHPQPHWVHAPQPQQGPPPPHPQQHVPHPMAQNPYMQYPPQAHPHYYPHHPQQMQPPPPHPQSPYAVAQPHPSGPPQAPPPQMGPHPTQSSMATMYSQHPQHPHHPHPQAHPQSHWVHAPPPPQQGPPPPHPSQHMIPHPPQQISHAPQPAYYQPAQPPSHVVPLQPTQQLPPPASPHHPPSRTHTPQHPPTSQTPTRIPPPSSTPASPSNIPKVEKKDITFPKNSVEATKPVATKKRKLTSKDVVDIEIWRVLMCLKSGLLAESSWAIDVLSVLLNDDSTSLHFGLQHMPGLLEVVLEHFKCCLNELFDGIVNDTTLKPVFNETVPEDKLPIKKENGVSKNVINNNNNDNHSNNNNNLSTNNNNINGIKTESIVSKSVINKKKINGVVENSSVVDIHNLSEHITMLKTAKNYTSVTRDGKIVKMKNGVTPVQEEPLYELIFKPVGYSHWQEGKGEDTSHIQVYFEPNNFIESSRRCTCLSTIIRNLSFIPGNDVEMSKHAGLLLVLGRLLLLKHDDLILNESESSPTEWHLLNSLREDSLVIISNISSSLDLSPYNDRINLSLLDGLLHWSCCSSSYAQDPFPAPSLTVSPQRLALESLAKLSIIEGNVDLILATPPWSRTEKLFGELTRLLNINEDQTIREFSLVLLSNLTSADSGIARKVALTGSAIPRLLSFLETSVADPETYATTQDMLRRAASTLKSLSQLVDNHPLFVQHQQRLLYLVMSQRLDQEVVPIIADVIFEISLSD